MSKKYKELPAFETNEFKVGDLVKAYAGHLTEDLVYEIEEIRGNYLKLNREYTLAHFKQCRKLVEVKPREFWVTEVGLERAKEGLSIATFTLEEVTNDDNIRAGNGPFIKVREVLEGFEEIQVDIEDYKLMRNYLCTIDLLYAKQGVPIFNPEKEIQLREFIEKIDSLIRKLEE